MLPEPAYQEIQDILKISQGLCIIVVRKSHYEDIKKVYSIWICMNPPKNRENSITRYYITEENLVGSVREQKADYDLMAAIMICLGRPEDKEYAGVLKLLDVLLSTETSPTEKCQILEEDFQIEMTQTLESEVSLMCNLSKGVEEKGREQGREQGEDRMSELIKRLVEDNRSSDIIKITQDKEYRKKLYKEYGII